MATEDARKRSGGDVASALGAPATSISNERKLPAAEEGPRRRIVVKSADMEEALQKEAIDCAVAAVDKHKEVKDIAEYIKKQFDKNHGSSWHCIVGSNFGSYVTHEANHFMYFYLDQRAILLFKSG